MVSCSVCVCFFFFFKQKTAYEMRISDWSSDVCSSDLLRDPAAPALRQAWLLGLKSGLSGFIELVARRLIPFPCAPDRPAYRCLWPRQTSSRQIGRASCRERVCQYV